MVRIPVALQMYTVRDQLKEDFDGTFRKVAAIGYEGVELAGAGDRSAADIKKMLDGLNLKIAGSHVGWAALESDLDKVIEDNLTLGNPYVVCPSVPQDRRGSAEGYRETARKLSQIGETLKGKGIQLCYHNHSFEFVKLDGRIALDLLYEASDPRFLQAEIDTYWVQHGHEDPAAYVRKYANRCPLVHLKDMEAGEDRFFAEVGEGIMDFKAIFDAADAAGSAWYIVEQDRCRRDPIDSARISFENLRKMGKA